MERNMWNSVVREQAKADGMADNKWGCQLYNPDDRRTKFGNVWEFQLLEYAIGRHKWHGLCLYNDQSVKYYSRLKKVEKENAYQEYYQVCIHNWDKSAK